MKKITFSADAGVIQHIKHPKALRKSINKIDYVRLDRKYTRQEMNQR